MRVYPLEDGISVYFRVTTEPKRAEEALRKAHDELEERVEARTAALARANEQIYREMKEREQSEEALHRSQRLASLGTLAAGIAHEINNPVGAALLAAEMALEIKDQPDERCRIEKCLKNVIASMERCRRIVRNVLMFSRNEPTEKRPCQINEVVQQSWDLTSEYARHHETAVRLILDENLAVITVNRLEMEMVLVNLLRNAIEASGQNGQIVIRTELADDGAKILIEDDGRGMTDEEKAHLFDPFYSTRQGNGGTGLGASIAYGIVQDHRGTIQVESEPGEGTTMTVTLPVRKDLQE